MRRFQGSRDTSWGTRVHKGTHIGYTARLGISATALLYSRNISNSSSISGISATPLLHWGYPQQLFYIAGLSATAHYQVGIAFFKIATTTTTTTNGILGRTGHMGHTGHTGR